MMTWLLLMLIVAVVGLVVLVGLTVIVLTMRSGKGGRKTPPPALEPHSLEEIRRQLGELHELLERTEQRIDELYHRADGKLPGGERGSGSEVRPREEILRLSRQGLDAVEIARRMDMDVGEIELVLNLGDSGRCGEQA